MWIGRISKMGEGLERTLFDCRLCWNAIDAALKKDGLRRIGGSYSWEMRIVC